MQKGKKRMAEQKAAVCVDCGKIFPRAGVGMTPKRCPACRAKHTKQLNREWRRKNRRGVATGESAERPQTAVCSVCGKEFAIAPAGKIPAYCPACRKARNVRMTVEREKAKKAKYKKRAHPGGYAEKPPRRAKMHNGDSLEADVRALAEENARREARGLPPLSYGRWKLKTWWLL